MLKMESNYRAEICFGIPGNTEYHLIRYRYGNNVPALELEISNISASHCSEHPSDVVEWSIVDNVGYTLVQSTR